LDEGRKEAAVVLESTDLVEGWKFASILLVDDLRKFYLNI
jgi:hypothetical protein